METKLISGIYKIINKVNGKYYVGSSYDILSRKGRKYQHTWMLRNNRCKNYHLQMAWNKYKEESFEFIIIECNISRKKLLKIEQKYLDIAKKEKDRCYNTSFIAGDIEMTEEVRKKISNKRRLFYSIKENNCMYNKHHTEETKKKISRSNKGKKRSEEVKKKMSEQRAGKKHPRYKKTIFKLKNIINNEIFIGTRYEFREKYGFYKMAINNLLKENTSIIKKQWILIEIDGEPFKTKPTIKNSVIFKNQELK